MRLRTTLLLLGSTLALLGYIFLHERYLENSRDAAASSTRVNAFAPEEANTVLIEGPKGKSKFRKSKDGVWMMIDPVEDRADQQLLSSFVTQAADMTIVETMRLDEIVDEESGGTSRPEEIGFGAKETQVSIQKGEAVLASFTIGASTEFEDVHYVSRGGKWSGDAPVLAVLSRLFETAALPVDKLRDPHLIPATADEIRQIKFAEVPTGLMLKRDILAESADAPETSATGERTFVTTPWRLTQPIDTRADKQTVDDRIAALLGVTIVEFSDESAAPAAVGELQDGKREIRVWTFTSKAKTIVELSDSPEAEAGGYLLARVTDRPGALRISRDILKAFTINPTDLRDRHLADIRFETVLTIDLQGHAPDGTAEPPVNLARYGSNFALMRRGQKEKADADKVKELIRALNKEEVEFVADSAANPALFGLDRPIRLVSITTEIPDPTAPSPPPGTPPTMVKTKHVLRIGEGPKPRPTALGKLYATFDESPFVYGISPELLGKLEPQTIRWKSPELLRFSLFDLKGITIRRPPQPPLDIAYDAGTNRWIANANGQDLTANFDEPKVRAFGEALSFLHGNGWTADPTTALQRIRDETILDITVRIQDRNSNKPDEIRLRIAPPSPGLTRSATYYGQLNEVPDVFLVDRATFNVLNANLLKESKNVAPETPETPVPTPPSPEPAPVPGSGIPEPEPSAPPEP